MKNYLISVLFIVLIISACEKDEEKVNLQACFEYSFVSGNKIGDTVKFTNCSEDAITYAWNFGDGQISTSEETSHIYSELGDFTVTLIVKNGDVIDSVSKIISIGPKGYIINYGSYSGDKSTVAYINPLTNDIIKDYFQLSNPAKLSSNIQYAYVYKENIYMMGNDLDQLVYVNKYTLKQTKNGATNNIQKPRYCVGDVNYLYVSCWGATPDWDVMPGSYIAKYNIESNTVEKKIALPGGPEGLAIANGNLYATLNYKDSVAVIDLANDNVSYIATPAVSSYFLKDKEENLYVSFVSTYSDPSTESGIGYINTATNTVDHNYKLDGISSNYGSIMQFNNDSSKIYIIASAWVEVDGNWIQQGAVNVFNTVSKSHETTPFLSGVSGINGISVNPESGNVYCFISTGATTSGEIKVYSPSSDLLISHTAGISPSMAVFVE